MSRSKKYTAVIVFAAVLVCCFFVAATKANAGATSIPPAPTLLSPNSSTVTGMVKPVITGLTASGSSVYIYIDGVFNGSTETLLHKSGTANFAYKPFLNLSVGAHTVWAIAKDKDGKKSSLSNILHFNIEEPYPAPVLFAPKINEHTVFNLPFILGLVKNDSSIKVYIDRQFAGQFKVDNNKSGTANFAYLTKTPLTEGHHMVYAVSIDSRGKESVWSNIIYFNIKRPINPAISRAAASEALFENKELGLGSKENAFEFREEDGKAIKVINVKESSGEILNKEKSDGNEPEKFEENITYKPETIWEESEFVQPREEINTEGPKNDELSDKQPEEPDPSEEFLELWHEEDDDIGTVTATAAQGIAEIDKYINQDKDKINNYNATGLIDESTRSQSGLRYNLVIFVLFLLAVIGWIFWVNRELIKEKRDAAVKDDNDEEDVLKFY